MVVHITQNPLDENVVPLKVQRTIRASTAGDPNHSLPGETIKELCTQQKSKTQVQKQKYSTLIGIQ